MPPSTAPPLFRPGQPGAGYAHELANDPRSIRASKLSFPVQVAFIAEAGEVDTPEGHVRVRPGDALITDEAGNRWPVPPDLLAARYQPIEPVVAGQAGSYLSVPYAVLARQMDAPFQVLLPDGISRLTGQAGDWLVGTAGGGLHVVSATAFARTYRKAEDEGVS